MCGRDGQPLRPLEDKLIGKTVGGRYRLISRLGQGGMSSVYLARHVLIDRLVAVKCLRRDLSTDSIQRDRFIREARAVNRINHANIVEINDFGETEDGLVYLVMEYVPGSPLLRSLNEAPFETERALHYAEQIGAALGRAHQMGVVHRDLKPENILLIPRKDGFDAVKVLDFGIAKILDAPSLTGSQQIFGTPGYIAPEYIQSTDIDGRADLYSLGVMLYEMLTGALPFDYEYPGDLLVKHVTEKPVPPSTRHPDIEPALEAFILRCLEKQPEDRFRDAYHFVAELSALRERLGGDDSWGALSDAPASPDDEPQTVHDELAPDTPEETATEIISRTMPAPPPTMDSFIPSPPRASLPEFEPSGIDWGPAGVRRWRERYDSLADLLREAPATASVIDRLEQARQTLFSLEAAVAECEEHQRRIEELDASARDFRVTLGRAIGELGKKLSGLRGHSKDAEIRRDELQTTHQEKVAAVRRGDTTEGDADAVLWELATVQEELRVRAAEVAYVQSQLKDLQDELERRNEAAEDRLAHAVALGEASMSHVDRLADAMRDPLDVVEGHVREHVDPV